MLAMHKLALPQRVSPTVKSQLPGIAKNFAKRTEGLKHPEQVELLARQTLQQQFPGVQAAEQKAALVHLIMQSAVVEHKSLGAELDAVSQKLDSMGDLSMMQQQRLQMLMDGFTKMMEAVSNITKKMSDTQNAIIQNMK
jgi:hypothetical protein